MPGRKRLFGHREDEEPPRVIRDRELFTTDEILEGRAVLPDPPPAAREPEDGGTEPWGDDRDTERHRLYREFLAARGSRPEEEEEQH